MDWLVYWAWYEELAHDADDTRVNDWVILLNINTEHVLAYDADRTNPEVEEDIAYDALNGVKFMDDAVWALVAMDELRDWEAHDADTVGVAFVAKDAVAA